MYENVKIPTRYEFILTNLPLVSLCVFLVFILYPLVHIIEYIVGISPSINFFPSTFHVLVYGGLISLLQLYILYLHLQSYKKMKNSPFLTFNNIIFVIDKSLSSRYTLTGRNIILTLKWNNITQINATQNNLHIHYKKNNKIKSEKIDIRWCEQKDALIKTLKTLCNNHGITIIDNTSTISNNYKQPENHTINNSRYDMER